VSQNSLEKTDLYEVTCVLGKKLRTTKRYFEFITQVKHPELRGKLNEVLETLIEANEVRRNTEHPEIYLYYRKINRHWICAVTRHLDGDGFLVTAYITGKSKRKGEQIWPEK